MNVTPLTNHVATANVPLEQLAKNHALTEDQKVAEASRQFEAVLLRQILQETQKPVIKSKFTDNSTAAGIYHDMAGNQLADSISKSGTVGLAQTLQRQLTRQLHPAAQAGQDPASAALPTATAGSSSARPPLSDNHKPVALRPLHESGVKLKLDLHERLVAPSH
jgi:flagellar protein FlgJ